MDTDDLKLKFWADYILRENIEWSSNFHNILVDRIANLDKNVKNNLCQYSLNIS